MKELEKQLALISLALNASDEQLSELMKNNVITSEEYLRITDDRREKEREFLEKRRDELVFLIQVEEDKQVQKTADAIKKREESKQLAREKSDEAKRAAVNTSKELKGKISSISEEDKKKGKKAGILTVVVIVLVLIGANIMNYLVNNVIGFTDIDFADDVIMMYDTNKMTATPSFIGNWNYFTSSGYYSDSVSALVASGIYTQEEAESYIPEYDEVVATALQDTVISFESSTQEELGNGDTIEVTVIYDEEVAKQNKLNITNNIIEFTVEGLQEPIVAADINADVIAEFESDEVVANSVHVPYKYIDEDYHIDLNTNGVYLKNSDSLSTDLVKLYTYEITGIPNYEDKGTCYLRKGIYKSDGEVVPDSFQQSYGCQEEDISTVISENQDQYQKVQ